MQAFEIQGLIFPAEGYSAFQNYRESLEMKTSNRYWLLESTEENCYVGISGIYREPCDDESVWLGWFGILPEFRRKGYASQALKLFEEAAKNRGFNCARLYTDADDIPARRLYEKMGYTGEDYCCPSDPASIKYQLKIYSKSLDAHPVKKWNNRNLNLEEQIRKQTTVM